MNKIQIAATLTTLALLTLSPSVASANTLHAFSTEFGSAGHEAGQLSGPTDVAVNSSTHDVYVADPGNHRVDEFTATGEFLLAFGADVGGAGINTCTLTCQAGTAGSAPGQLEAPTFVAVDNSGGESEGDVYVADTATKLVQKFTATGELVTAWGDHVNGAEEPEPDGQLSGRLASAGAFPGIAGIAVDGTGDLLVFAPFSEQMYEFEQTGAFVQNFEADGSEGSEPGGIAVDGAGDLYRVAAFGTVKMAPTGARIGYVTGKGTGLAADLSSNDLYVDTGTEIKHFPSTCEPPPSHEARECSPAESFGSSHLSAAQGIAVDSSDSTVFAAETSADRILSFAKALEATTGAASNITATTATLNGTVNPEGSEVSECFFEYGEEQHAPCVETVGSGNAEVPVHADVSGLQGGTSYRFHLVVRDATGVLAGEQQEFATSPVATISDLASGELTATSAALSAKVNPHGLAVEGCRFEYATSTSYDHSVPCAQSEAQIGAGEAPVPVSATITGLEPNRTYHWRLVAEDENGKGATASASADQTFIYDTATAQLPDGRQYEMVTPPAANGALIGSVLSGLPIKISGDGHRVFAPSLQCFGAAQSCDGTHVYEGGSFEFARTPSGWVAVPLTPPASEFPVTTTWSFGPEPGSGLFSMATEAGDETFYARRPSGAFDAIGPIRESAPPGGDPGLFKEVTSTTSDLSHIVYEGQTPLWPSIDSGGREESLYEYIGTGNAHPLVVGLKNGAASKELVSVCGTVLGGGPIGATTQDRVGSLSEDGRTIYFAAEPCSEGGSNVPVREIYARIDASRTEAISEPAANSACTTPECLANTGTEHTAQFHPSVFAGASSDGSSVFFTSTQQLTDGAAQDNSADSAVSPGCTQTTQSGCNLYESECPEHCEDPAARRTIDVSEGDSSGEGPRVQGVTAVSADGSHVYFVAKGVLTSVPNSEGQRARSGQLNLYVFEHAAGSSERHVAFIGQLSEADKQRWSEGGVFDNVTPDGRYLVFTSSRALTADDTRAEGPAQIYRYDAQTAGLVRISIGEEGFNDDGNASTGSAAFVPAAFGSHESPRRPDPTMSNDGSYVFFESPAALTSQAIEAPGASNVYEYHDGQVSLISDGKDTVGHSRSAGAVELLGSDESGANVFFTTTDPLVAQDTNTQRDIYDAHECSSAEPCLPAPPTPATPCSEEGCHGAANTAPAPGPPASSTFAGTGNLVSPVVKPIVKAKPLTRAQKLAKALNVCKRDKSIKKRSVCEKRARRVYGRSK